MLGVAILHATARAKFQFYAEVGRFRPVNFLPIRAKNQLFFFVLVRFTTSRLVTAAGVECPKPPDSIATGPGNGLPAVLGRSF